MPETTMSGTDPASSLMPIFTQSAGVPQTAYPRKEPPLAALRTISGRESVMACPTADCSVSGATIRQSASFDSSS